MVTGHNHEVVPPDGVISWVSGFGVVQPYCPSTLSGLPLGPSMLYIRTNSFPYACFSGSMWTIPAGMAKTISPRTHLGPTRWPWVLEKVNWGHQSQRLHRHCNVVHLTSH